MSANSAHPERSPIFLTPLIWISLAFICGIILASFLKTTSQNWILLGAISSIVLVLCALFRRFTHSTPAIYKTLRSKLPSFLGATWTNTTSLLSGVKYPVPLALLIVVLSLGALRYHISQPTFSPKYITYYNDAQLPYIIEGIINKPPDIRDSHTNLVIQVKGIRLSDKAALTSVDGLIQARVSPDEDWKYGDLIQLEGYIETPHEDETFSYRDYLARRGIFSYMRSLRTLLLMKKMGNPLLNVIYSVRERAYDTIYKLFPDPEASLFAGILVGIESGIPSPVMESFNATGTSHIIAISGFNIAILSALFVKISGRFVSRWRAAIFTIIAIAFYTILVGADSAVIRAGIMGGLSLFAIQLGRRQDGLNSLALAAAVMAIANPMVVGDLSFLLSFFATLGLILYAEPLSELFKQNAIRWISQPTLDQVAGYISEYILFTLAAQVVTMPIIAYYFNRISLISILANPIILPAQPLLMILGGVATILGMIFLPLGKIIAAVAYPFAVYTIRSVEVFARIPNREIVLEDPAITVIILFYALLFLATFFGNKIKTYFYWIKPGFILTLLSISTILVWQLALTQPDSKLHMTLLDVSANGLSGNAIFIVTPTGRHVLVDGGPHTSLLSDGLGRRMSLINRNLDWLVVASPSENELASLPRIIERFPPANALWAGATHGNFVSRELWEGLTLAQIPVTLAEAGHTLELGGGAQLKILSIGQRGAVLLLEWRNFRALLPLGIDLDYIEDTNYGQAIGEVSVLILAESGYIPVNPEEWIAHLNPQLALISVAADDSQGLPSPETLQTLQGYSVLRTDKNGWIEFTTDGEQMWVDVEQR